MLSWPRFDAYTYRPDGCTAISAVLFDGGVPSGTVGMVCRCTSVPVWAFQANTAIVLDSSVSTYAYRPDGWSARCLGPEPGSSPTKAGRCGAMAPVLGSWRYT